MQESSTTKVLAAARLAGSEVAAAMESRACDDYVTQVEMEDRSVDGVSGVSDVYMDYFTGIFSQELLRIRQESNVASHDVSSLAEHLKATMVAMDKEEREMLRLSSSALAE